MSDDADLHRRVTRLEGQHDKLIESTQQLVISTKLLTESVSQMSDVIKEIKNLEPRIRHLEMDVSNNKLISRGLIWTASTVGASAIVMFLTYLVNLGS